MRAFLGFCSYYQRFNKDFAHPAGPLYDMLRKSTVFRWTEACQASITDLRDAMVSAPILAFPEFGREAELLMLMAVEVALVQCSLRNRMDKSE